VVDTWTFRPKRRSWRAAAGQETPLFPPRGLGRVLGRPAGNGGIRQRTGPGPARQGPHQPADLPAQTSILAPRNRVSAHPPARRGRGWCSGPYADEVTTLASFLTRRTQVPSRRLARPEGQIVFRVLPVDVMALASLLAAPRTARTPIPRRGPGRTTKMPSRPRGARKPSRTPGLARLAATLRRRPTRQQTRPRGPTVHRWGVQLRSRIPVLATPGRPESRPEGGRQERPPMPARIARQRPGLEPDGVPDCPRPRRHKPGPTSRTGRRSTRPRRGQERSSKWLPFAAARPGREGTFRVVTRMRSRPKPSYRTRPRSSGPSGTGGGPRWSPGRPGDKAEADPAEQRGPVRQWAR